LSIVPFRNTLKLMVHEDPMLKSVLASCLALFFTSSFAADSGEAKVRAALGSLTRGAKIEAVAPAPMRG